MASALAGRWALDPEIVFLNHGSFGACPRVVLEAQQSLRERLEREPIAFMLRDLEQLQAEARESLGELLGAHPDDLAFVPNATSGVNTVLRSLDLQPGDELLTTDHTYGACRITLDRVAAQQGARVVCVSVPFPLDSSEQVLQAILRGISPRTKLALIDHVTSPTALVFPLASIVTELAARGVDTLVDGAHGPGMVPLALDQLGAAYYTANCHKWLCAPKGSAFLHVRRDRQAHVHPLVLSHGVTSPRRDRSRFRLEHDWQGTCDPTPWLVLPTAVQFLQTLMPGGITELMAHNRALALRGQRILLDALCVPAPAPQELLGSMITVPLPPAREPWPEPPAFAPLQDALFHDHRIEVPIFPWPDTSRRWLRITAQAYNDEAEYRRLAGALRELLR
jgi:isopenicillin-N epimerase